MALRYSGEGNEVNCVGAFDGTVTLGESADFFTVGVDPNRAVATFAELAVFGHFTGVRIDGVAEKSILLMKGNAWKGRLGGTCIVE